MFFLDTYKDFGQRDSLALMFCLPYFCLAAAKRDGTKYSLLESITAGLMAGMGLSLKPYFLLVPVLVELVTFKRWDWKRHFRPETYAVVFFMFAYVGFLFMFVQEYLFEAVPMIKQIYWGFETSSWTLMMYSAEELSITFICLTMLFGQKSNVTLVKVMFAVALGFLVSYFVQNKGYSYHQSPFRGSLFIAVSVWISSLSQNYSERKLKAFLQVTLICLVVISVNRTGNWFLSYNSFFEGGSTGNTQRGTPAEQSELIARVNKHARSKKFLAFSTHPYPGFPTAAYVDAEWASRTNSRVFLPAVAKLRSMNLPKDDERLVFAETMERKFAFRDLSQQADVILVDSAQDKHGLFGVQFDILEFYREDPQFRELWRAYNEVEQIGATRVFVRSKSQ
ncbi:hypothetical protein OAF98_02210 [Planctomicrobium sp.]|nr:hypothetical protein [Planctomicrobium sp.]MDB4439825.1 hypothetical protein [Planctomicrobium sp.]MDB4733188.1 hypothetical protein [Planctomicrobium sp.]MDB4743275.1 hypothetical protein [Planctomicrobium sp.]